MPLSAVKASRRWHTSWCPASGGAGAGGYPNQVVAAARAPVEHGFAALKNWRILTRLRLNPARATALLRTLLVLTNLETSR
ncbi:transposase family protein [Catenulispora subtropica]|uniref:DDE Tnp4 domain-containing protein n=1 Tax=Catenulispora subtropica TaxID=450798 RepID=A0ABP5DL47_9ACTN